MSDYYKKHRIQSDYIVKLDNEVVSITDLDLGQKSVASNMEQVLENIYENGCNWLLYPIIYRDSLGCWDQVVVNLDGGYFRTEFRALDEVRDYDLAVAKVKNLRLDN